MDLFVLIMDIFQFAGLCFTWCSCEAHLFSTVQLDCEGVEQVAVHKCQVQKVYWSSRHLRVCHRCLLFFDVQYFVTACCRGVYYSTPSLVFLSSITGARVLHFVIGGFRKTSNWNSDDISTPTSTKLTHDVDPYDHYLTMTSVDHAHFRFTFYGRLHFFRFSLITPWPLTTFTKFFRRLVGVGGPQKFWGRNLDICPPQGGQTPRTEISLLGIVIFFVPSEFRLTPLIGRGQGPLRSCKKLQVGSSPNSRNWGLKILEWGFTPLGGCDASADHSIL